MAEGSVPELRLPTPDPGPSGAEGAGPDAAVEERAPIRPPTSPRPPGSRC
ncbi:hypothetical protein O1L60_33810 [Streptomyces diastatochromogenes]|nr:hypothetical protein [Streptomyces diastatochromogenes]